MGKEYQFMVPDDSFETRLENLQKIISESKHLAFFGGAGVSTESGIPDFRSKDGLYNQKDVNFSKFKPEYLLSHDCLFRRPNVFYEFYRQKLDTRNIEPNITHKKLAEFESNGKRVSIITQNIDGLHQKAGNTEVYEIHGTTMRNYCSKCGREFPNDYIFHPESYDVQCEDKVPWCPDCGPQVGRIRPDVTLYGENLPKAFSEAVEVLHHADTLIVAGTSLSVYPAANLVTEFYGDNLIIINRDKTHVDAYANIVFHEELGDVFKTLHV